MMTDLSRYELSKKERFILTSCTGLAALALSMLLYRNVLFAILVIPFVPRIRTFAEEHLAARRKRKYMAEFKDFLFMASTAIGAGRSMKDAIGESIPSLVNIHGKDAVLVHDLSRAHDRMENGRENDVAVLREMAEASGLEDVSDFVSIYSICKSSGASLINALNRAAAVIMEKMSIENEISELVKRKESEGMVILVMPVLVLLFLNIFAPDYIAPMYETPAGRIIMSICAAGTAGVFVMIKKITGIEI